MKRMLGTFACIVALSACAGGGSTPALRSSQSQSAVALSVHIPETTTSSGKRVPKYVSPSTQGIHISDSVHGSGVTAFTADVDLSSGSAACTAVTGGRTCTVSITAPAGTDDFTFTTYDVPPGNANFGLAAHELGTATVTATIVGGTNNTVNVALGGVPQTIDLLVPYTTIYGDGSFTFNLGIEALDADGNIILAGFNTATNGANGETDTYASPITVSETETNGSGYTLLSLNGGPGATQVTVTKTTDTVTVLYSHTPVVPIRYSVEFFATASSVSPSPPGSSVITVWMSGTGPGTFVNGASPSLSFQTPNQVESFTVAEFENGFTDNFSAVGPTNSGSANCPNGSISLDTSSFGRNGSLFTVTAGVVATSGTGCAIHISDSNTLNVTMYVTNAADPILYVPDQTTIAVDMYDSITYASLGSFSVANGNATSLYAPVTAALDKVFGRLWVGYIGTFVGTAPPSGLVQAYQTQTNNSLIASDNLQFATSRVTGIATTTSGIFTLYVNLADNTTLNEYSIATDTPAASGSNDSALVDGLFYDNTSGLLYVAGDTARGQDFADAYNASNVKVASSTIAEPSGTARSFGVAVDDTHTLVYVTDTNSNTVDIFNYSAANALVGTIAAPANGAHVLGLLLDAHGKLFVSYSSPGEILVYDTTNGNALLHTIVTNANAYGMAIDPGT